MTRTSLMNELLHTGRKGPGSTAPMEMFDRET
jgi:hypothetical protein